MNGVKITVDELAIMLANYFTQLDHRINQLEDSLRGEINKVNGRLDHMEIHYERRFGKVEERTVILKKAVEKGLDTKIAW